MVELSKSIANKIKDKQGDITEDEVSFGDLLWQDLVLQSILN